MALTYPGVGPSAGGGGIESVATWGDLPAASGSEEERVVLDSGLRVTDCDVEGEFHWLPSEAVRKDDGTLYTLAWARDAADNKTRLRPGDTVPAAWSVSGTVTTTGGYVNVTGYVNCEVVSTAPRALVLASYAALPDAGVAESGVAGGCVVGGTGRWINTRLQANGHVTHGLYQTDTSGGHLDGAANRPIFGLIEQTTAQGPVRAWSAAGAPGQAVASKRSDMNTGGAYFQVMSVNGGGTGVLQQLNYAGLLVMT